MLAKAAKMTPNTKAELLVSGFYGGHGCEQSELKGSLTCAESSHILYKTDTGQSICPFTTAG